MLHGFVNFYDNMREYTTQFPFSFNLLVPCRYSAYSIACVSISIVSIMVAGTLKISQLFQCDGTRFYFLSTGTFGCLRLKILAKHAAFKFRLVPNLAQSTFQKKSMKKFGK